jgi:hypothetical protein
VKIVGMSSYPIVLEEEFSAIIFLHARCSKLGLVQHENSRLSLRGLSCPVTAARGVSSQQMVVPFASLVVWARTLNHVNRDRFRLLVRSRNNDPA